MTYDPEAKTDWTLERLEKWMAGEAPEGGYTHTFTPGRGVAGSATIGPRQGWRLVWYLATMLLRHPRTPVTFEWGDDA